MRKRYVSLIVEASESVTMGIRTGMISTDDDWFLIIVAKSDGRTEKNKVIITYSSIQTP